MVVFSETSIRYLTGFTGEEAQLVIFSDGSSFLLSDSRFASQLKTEVPSTISVVMKTRGEMPEIVALLHAHASKKKF